MAIEAAFIARLTRDAEPRVSQSGKSWTRLFVGCGHDENRQWLTVSCFGALADKAAKLAKDDKIYVEGALSLRTWEADGKPRSGLCVNATRVESPKIGRNKPKRQHVTQPVPVTAPATAIDFDDPLPTWAP